MTDVPRRSADEIIREQALMYAKELGELYHAAQARTEQLDLVLRAAGEGIFGVDTEGRITFANPAAAKILGLTEEDMIAKDLHGSFHHSRGDGSPYPQEECPVLAAFRDGQTHEVADEVFWRADGSSVPVDYVVTPMRRHGQLTGAVVTFKDVTDRRRAEEELRRSLAMLRRSDEERRRLLAELVRAQEEERRRISADIHDDSVQVMSAVSMRLQILERRIADPDQRRLLSDLSDAVVRTITRLRNLMFDLRPPALDLDGLTAALRQQLDSLEEEYGIDYELDSSITREPEGESRVLLYRIGQEALTNARKHARASKVEVSIEPRDGGVLLRIADDGSGFDPGAEPSSPRGHLGLTAMRERAEMMDGWFRITSEPGAGTTVEVWVPQPRDGEPPEGGIEGIGGILPAPTGGPSGVEREAPRLPATDEPPRRSALPDSGRRE